MDWTDFTTTDGSTTGWVSDGDDAVVLVLHGGPGLSDYTDGLAAEVRQAVPHARIARYQQRGLSPSTTEGPFTVEQHVADLFAVADHLGAETLVLVGHSWGGHLAMHAAVGRPDRVAGLVLVDSLGAVGDGGQSTLEPVIVSRLGEEALAELAGLADAGLSPIETGTRQIQLMWPGYFADPASAPPPPPMAMDPTVFSSVMDDVGRLLAAGDLERRLGEIDVPSAHVIGRASPIDPEVNHATAALCRDATVVELDCGHFAWLEQPGAVADAVAALR